MTPAVFLGLLLGALASVPWGPWARRTLAEINTSARRRWLVVADLSLFLVLALSLAEGLGGTSTPFIYFRF